MNQITPRRIVNALKSYRLSGKQATSYPMSRRRLADAMKLDTQAEREELRRVLKKMWPGQYRKWGVSYRYYPTGWRVQLEGGE